MTVRQLSGSDKRVSLIASRTSSLVSMAAIGPLSALSATSRARRRAAIMIRKMQYSNGKSDKLTRFHDVSSVGLLVPVL